MFKNIKFGIKISTQNFDLLPDIYQNKDMLDFIEIILMPDFDIEDIKIIADLRLPYAIHLPNSNQGIDFGNLNYKDKTNLLIAKINNYSNKFKKLTPICYVVHPESGDIELSITNIKKLKINPVAIENMPKKSIHTGNCIGDSPESLIEYFNQIKNLEFCFDISHAIKASIFYHIKYINYIKDFLNFKKPILFHISGGTLDVEFDEHLPLMKSEYDLGQILKILINYDSVVNLTFETPRDYTKKIQDDLKNIDYCLNFN